MHRRALLMLFVATAIGCGSTGPTGPSAAEGFSSSQKIGELSEWYNLAQMSLKRPPGQQQDLKPYSRGFPAASTALIKGEIVVRWGANLGQGTGILAYEKDAATAGGWVLLQDRKIVQMTAAEFAAAPKAGP